MTANQKNDQLVTIPSETREIAPQIRKLHINLGVINLRIFGFKKQVFYRSILDD